MKDLFFVRNNIRADDLCIGVEEYIRNNRGPVDDGGYDREVSFSSLQYRFPYRTNNHQWKLIRDENKPEGVLTIIGKNVNNFQYQNTPHRHIDLKEIAKACSVDKHSSVYGSVFYGIPNPTGTVSLDDLKLLTKDNKGRLVDWDSGDVLYESDKDIEHDYRNHQSLMMFPISIFKFIDLPIYTIILDNNLIINKVLFEVEGNELNIYGEELPLNESIFFPTFNGIIQVNDNLIATDYFYLDLFGYNEWETYNGIHTQGCVMEAEDCPDINNSVNIDTNLKYEFTGNGQIKFTPPDRVGYIKLSITSGAFFETCLEKDMFNWEWIVYK